MSSGWHVTTKTNGMTVSRSPNGHTEQRRRISHERHSYGTSVLPLLLRHRPASAREVAQRMGVPRLPSRLRTLGVGGLGMTIAPVDSSALPGSVQHGVSAADALHARYGVTVADGRDLGKAELELLAEDAGVRLADARAI